MGEARTGFVRYLLLLTACAVTSLGAGTPQQPPGTIRTRITMVPLDVRVLDRDGKPVTDLTQDDFTITEDGRPQKIGHFSIQSLSAEPSPASTQSDLRKPAAAGLAPGTRRVFLLVLGRGRMTGPSGELRALDEFVRERLLPQDQVALLAYNRATDFTTDHSKLAGVIARYRASHTKIESMLAQHFSGLQAIYGSKKIPARIQNDIDALFEPAGSIRPREITPGQITDSSRLSDDVRRTADKLRTAEIQRDRAGDSSFIEDTSATTASELLDLSFDAYIADQVELMQDMSNLYAGIQYLRHLDGEKHLAFVTPRGLSLPRAEDDMGLAAIASDARVAMHVVFTGGVAGAPPPRVVQGPQGTRIVTTSVPSASAVFSQTFNVQSLRRLAERTGGQLTAFRKADEGFRRLDQSTRFQYLLGYYPLDANWNGAFRRIDVKVSRPGVTVLFRRGYFASQQLVPIDRREFLTHTRMSAAGRYDGQLQDIGVTLRMPSVTGEKGAQQIAIEGSIDLSRVTFTQVDGRHTAALDIGIYAGDSKEQVIGETLKRVDLKLRDESYETARRTGVPFNAMLRVTGSPAYVKVIVFDYASDLLGSAVVRIRK